MRSGKVVLLSTEVFLLISPRRKRRIPFHWVERTLENEGNRSKPRFDTVYESDSQSGRTLSSGVPRKLGIPAGGSKPCFGTLPSLLWREGCRQYNKMVLENRYHRERLGKTANRGELTACARCQRTDINPYVVL
jgi:hypothetical protein